MLGLLAFYLLGRWSVDCNEKPIIDTVERIVYQYENTIIQQTDTLYLKQKAKIITDTIFQETEIVEIIKYAEFDSVFNVPVLVNHRVENVSDTTYKRNLRVDLNVKFNLNDSIYLVKLHNHFDTLNFVTQKIVERTTKTLPVKWYKSPEFEWSLRTILFCGGVYVGSQIEKK